MAVQACKRVEDIPVYPEFKTYKKSHCIHNNPHICEDDNGRLAFLTQAHKDAYLREHGGRR